MTEAPAKWNIEMFETDEDGCPVQEFLEDLDKRSRAKVMALIERLAEAGPALPFPYSTQVKGKLRELRTQLGKTKYRVLYFGGPDRTFILLHAVEKHTKALQVKDVHIAESRMKEYLERD